MRASRTAPAKLVVVIDDDPLVREATGMLLRSWGCRVVTAESYDDAVTRLATSEPDRRPDLIVCDYHLSRGTTGVDAVKRLRSAFEIPALLITGDASSPPGETSPGGYHLLHKPVNAEAFRAALVDACVLQR
jgi:CheY-like chemotaxis protein